MGHGHVPLGGAPLSGASVLVVEDEFLIALEAQRIFQDAGATDVVLANSVAQARSLLARGTSFNFGFLDLKLGDEDARPLVSDLTQRGIPILIATGLDETLELSGRTSLIRKPYRDAEVLCAARTLLAT